MKTTLRVAWITALFLLADCVLFADGTNMKLLFSEAQAPLARRDACVRMIDGGVVRRGITLNDTKELFGAWFRLTGGKTTDGLSVAVVSCEATPQGSSYEKGSAGHRGWYLVLHFSSQDRLVYYYLSNVNE